MGNGGSSTTVALLGERARSSPDSVALVAPGREPATYGELHRAVGGVASLLRERGIRPGDRVALVVPNGPEAAVAFMAASQAGSCAPLNPVYRRPELEFFLDDLRARAVIVGADVDSPARDVAARLGIEVFELSVAAERAAGMFTLDGDFCARSCEVPQPDAEALVLHTSGTTARPKVVPLTHGQLSRSAVTIAMTLALDPGDRCLNVMPLFHIHGLVASVLASLAAGASIACTPGFHRHHVLRWLIELEPTWMTAVPTMYQGLLDAASGASGALSAHRLRLVRSSSAALPVPVLERLEALLGVPVIEAYGMTEAAHQMASNPLPPGARKPGSVGVAAGPEIAVVDDEWRRLPPEEVGEVVIRGDQVFSGYEANPDANARAFRDGWFRTGDEGWLDDDGYLFLSGRLKEVINRGGEKVSPLEVDAVLLDHPAVAQAATFAMPHPRLGEEVAAAVVAHRDASPTEAELQDHAAQTIAPFKVPRRIIVVDEIPKGPTGKIQRVELASVLGVAVSDDQQSPDIRHGRLEHRIQEIWADVLGVPSVEPFDDFFALGGDSILGAEAVARVCDLLPMDIPLVTIVRAPTARAMTAEIERSLGWDDQVMVTVQAGDPLVRPVHYLHGADGEIIGIAAVARRLGSSRPVYALRPPGMDTACDHSWSVEELAERYTAEIRRVQPAGPYLIAGFCMGAATALEVAHRLEAARASVGLVLVDPRIRRPGGGRYRAWLVGRRAQQGGLLRALRSRLMRRSARSSGRPTGSAVLQALEAARDAYVCRATNAPTVLVRSEGHEAFDLPDWYLRGVFRNIVATEAVTWPHERVFRPPCVDDLSGAVERALMVLERDASASV